MTVPPAGLLSRYRLHHTGVVFPSLEDADAFIGQFGMEEDYRGYVPDWQSWCIFTKPEAGGTALELVVADGGPLLRFNKGMGGVHHFAFEVGDFDEVERWCAERDLKLLEPKPIKGAGDFWCNFIHPLSTRGIQIEFVQPW